MSEYPAHIIKIGRDLLDMPSDKSPAEKINMILWLMGQLKENDEYSTHGNGD